jgi:hypothetical protein
MLGDVICVTKWKVNSTQATQMTNESSLAPRTSKNPRLGMRGLFWYNIVSAGRNFLL